MSAAYVVGHITVKDEALWAQYRAAVPATLAPWAAELVFRGQRAAQLDGSSPHDDIVVIRFPDLAALESWFASPAYQALIPLRQQAAEIELSSWQS
jgi:uncharacterized protein (DUF1330 family)